MLIKPFKFQYQIQENETCLSYLGKFVEEMDKAANDFLDQFEFVPSNEIADNIWRLAGEAFKAHGEDWEKTPDWATEILDCGVPYCGNCRQNGSLWHALGLSLASQDAHLRCLWENLKNGTNHVLPFPVVVPKNIDYLII
jgi:hypothetical protein